MWRKIKRLWSFGTLGYPGNDLSIVGDWRVCFAAFDFNADRWDLDHCRTVLANTPWLQRLTIAQARWRLARAVIIGALLGAWLAS